MWWKRRVSMRTTTTEIKPIANGAWEKWDCRFYATFLIFIHFRDSDIGFVWKEKVRYDETESEENLVRIVFLIKCHLNKIDCENNVFNTLRQQSISLNAIDFLVRTFNLIIRLHRSIASGISLSTRGTSTFLTMLVNSFENVVKTFTSQKSGLKPFMLQIIFINQEDFCYYFYSTVHWVLSWAFENGKKSECLRSVPNVFLPLSAFFSLSAWNIILLINVINFALVHEQFHVIRFFYQKLEMNHLYEFNSNEDILQT